MPVHHEDGASDPVEVAGAAHRRARQMKSAALIVDTAGRLQIDEPMMDELARIREALDPREILLVADAMTGQEAVRITQGFDEVLGVTGFVLSKMDGDARGGAALSIHGVTGRPLKFVGTGEGVDDLEAVDPHRIAGRILQQGDVIGLVERARRPWLTRTRRRRFRRRCSGSTVSPWRTSWPRCGRCKGWDPSNSS